MPELGHLEQRRQRPWRAGGDITFTVQDYQYRMAMETLQGIFRCPVPLPSCSLSGPEPQVLVYHDMLGMLQHPHHAQFVPRFCKNYANVGEEVRWAYDYATLLHATA